MHNTSGWGGIIALGLLVLAGATPATAQVPPATERARIYLVPFVGGMWLSDLGKVEGRLLPPTGDLGDPPDRITNLTVGAQPALMAGFAAGLAVTRSLEIRLTAAFAATEFDLSGVTASGGDVEVFTTFGGLSRLTVISLHADLLWRLIDRRRPVSPYVAVGAGATIYDMDDPAGFFNVEPLTGIRLLPRTPRTSVAPAGVVGLGTDLRLGERTGLRFEIADVLSSNGLSDSDFEMSARFFGLAAADDVVHNVLVTVGVALALGGGERE